MVFCSLTQAASHSLVPFAVDELLFPAKRWWSRQQVIEADTLLWMGLLL